MGKDTLKIAAGVAAIVGFSTWQVFGRAPTKPGHDLASSEKPQALRNETERTLEGEKAKAAASKAAKAAANAAK